MTSKEMHNHHHKHDEVRRPDLGNFGRNELAIMGTKCDNIRKLVRLISERLSSIYGIAYVDASHHGNDGNSFKGLEYVALESSIRLAHSRKPTSFELKSIFNEQDLVLVNGNHFEARSQIAVIDPAKPLEKKLDRLTDVRLILLHDEETVIPDYMRKHISKINNIPVLQFDDIEGIACFIKQYLQNRIPGIKGLVLTGGKSLRMKKDKSALKYHGKSQRLYVFEMLKLLCRDTFVSCNPDQSGGLAEEYPLIVDTYIDLGPMSGILSAFQSNPDSAWLTVACDLPYLSKATLEFLIKHRNPSKDATAFYDPKGEFPEPLITVWEPRSYLNLLRFLSQGYTCPRKALINSNTELLHAPDVRELRNVNYPEEYEAAMRELAVRRL